MHKTVWIIIRSACLWLITILYKMLSEQQGFNEQKHTIQFKYYWDFLKVKKY